ncbi:MAG: enoyl-CoA hydratase-related protein [Candidatus Thermoplasmatota archaeon]|nr:enoyl-CoA hydratase-related protein [Candidatus Thermoplasmatota archaeon]MEE2625298.1 enoyl-CoA hydratase-related protein [Candidatus Thermoplasmatota archaeon]
MSDSMPRTELCRLEVDGPVARLNLTRTQVHNALNIQLISEITDVLEWAAVRSVGSTGELHGSDGSQNLRVLVISSEGRHFCAGADINMMREGGKKSAEDNRSDAELLDCLFHGLWSHPCFTIASVHGVALGGGAGLVACCDHAIATKETRIALSEAKLGILPAVIGPYVYRRVGSAQFRRLATLAGTFETDEALTIGMIDQIADNAEEASRLVEETIAALLTTGPVAVMEAKRLTDSFDRWTGTDEELREWVLDKTSEMRASTEGQEGLAAFLEGRKPAWSPEDQEG